MNATFFELKRAHHGVLRIARGTLKALNLTAARFDLLFALTNEGRERNFFMQQSALRRSLGVTRPTISRMLQSLEELGLVDRRPSNVDRRQLDVRLTARGYKRIRFAYRILVRSGWAQLALDSALGWNSRDEDDWHDHSYCFFEAVRLGEHLDKIRRTFGDFATLAYRWNPFDE